MTSTAKSIFYYSFYMLAMGLGLMFIPDLMLGLFGVEPTQEIWIRMLGLMVFCTGMLYFYCGLTDQTGFFRISVANASFSFWGRSGSYSFYTPMQCWPSSAAWTCSAPSGRR